VVVAGSVFAACKGGGGKPEAKPLGDSGFVVDAPSSWTVKSEMKDHYSVEADRRRDGFVGVMVNDGSGAASLDDYVKSAGCDDATKAIKEKTAAGTLYVQCEAVAGTMDGKPIKATRVMAQATDGKRVALCHIDSDHDIDTVAAVCKSLRKK
jgi:hypothetical protein